MLSDEQILAMARSMLWNPEYTGFNPVVFARAIEREATASLIDQIKQDEALMARALTSLDDYEAGAEIGKFDIQIIKALRKRLEANK